jgi:hypothetical protein
MLSKSFRASVHLLQSLDALHHGRALSLHLATWLAASIFWICGGFLLENQGWTPQMLTLSAMSVVLLIFGANAAGIMTMDELTTRPPRPWNVLWRQALNASQQMVMVLLTLIFLCLLVLLALALLLLVCLLPWLGTWLYAVTLPLATVIAAVVLFVCPVFVLALSAPAIWSGLDASTSLVQVWSVTKRRLTTATALLLMLILITAVSCLLLLGVLTLGLWLVNAMSASILGAPSAWLINLARVDGAVDMPVPSFAIASSAGIAAIKAVVASVASLIMIRGACLAYLRVLRGLDSQAEQQFVLAALAGVQKNWRGLRTQTTYKPAAVTATSSGNFSSPQPAHFGPSMANSQSDFRHSVWQHQHAPQTHQPIDIDIGLAVEEGAATCPACGSKTQLTDFYCGDCGQSLR